MAKMLSKRLMNEFRSKTEQVTKIDEKILLLGREKGRLESRLAEIEAIGKGSIDGLQEKRAELTKRLKALEEIENAVNHFKDKTVSAGT